MNTKILLIALVAFAGLTSCSSVYKTGQTPDDLYYSAPRPVADEYVANNKNQDNSYQTYEEYQDNVRNDRFLRMSVDNPYYMDSYNMYDGFDWRYNAMSYGGFYGYSSPWNSYYAWNNFYNPYCSGASIYYGLGGYYTGNHFNGGIVSAGNYYKTPISRPVAFNINSYSNSNKPARTYLSGNYNNINQRYNNGNTNTNRYYNNYSNSNNTSRSNSYTPSNNNSNNNSTPSRSYTPSSSSNSSSSGSSSGGGGRVSRPGRGG